MFKRPVLMFGLASLSLLSPVIGCAPAGDDEPNPVAAGLPKGKPDSSREATILDFEWDGALEAQTSSIPQELIESQLYYTIGQLNGSRAVGRMDRALFTQIQTESLPGGKSRVSFHATMPVAWG